MHEKNHWSSKLSLSFYVCPRTLLGLLQQAELRSSLFTALLALSWAFGADGLNMISTLCMFSLRANVYADLREAVPFLWGEVEVAEWRAMRRLFWDNIRDVIAGLIAIGIELIFWDVIAGLIAIGIELIFWALALFLAVIAAHIQIEAPWLPVTVMQNQSAVRRGALVLWVSLPLLTSQELRTRAWYYGRRLALAVHRRLAARTVPALGHNADDICGICLDTLNSAPLVHCRFGCGRALHEDCMREWLRTRRECIFCKAWWT